MATLTAPDTVSMDPVKLERAEELFRRQIAEGVHPGAGLAVYRYGKPVLDIQGGLADGDTDRAVSGETMFVLMSSTKPLAAACMYLLKERGLLAWEDAVCKYWPEFGKNGKEGVTLYHVMTHQGGFPATPKSLPWTDWSDWGKVVRAMEDATPTFTPGEVFAYHPVNYGWVIGELVRRIDGRDFSRFLSEEITGPLGMADTYVGLPEELDGRVAKIQLMEEDADPNGVVLRYNRPELHRSVVPAACGIASAGDLARFYAMLERGGALDGTRVLAKDTVREAVEVRVEATDAITGLFARRSLGLVIADERMGEPAGEPANTFGHGGVGTSIGWADTDSGLAMAYITNGCRAKESNDRRLAEISQAVRDACC